MLCVKNAMMTSFFYSSAIKNDVIGSCVYVYMCSGLTHLSVHVEKEGSQLCGPKGKGDVR